MFDEISKIDGLKGKEAGASSLAASLGAVQSQGVQAPEAPAGKEISDKIDVSKLDKAEDAGGANLEAIKGSYGNNQGFEPGMQKAFAINSMQGVQDGLPTGLQAAGVMKSPPEDK